MLTLGTGPEPVVYVEPDWIGKLEAVHRRLTLWAASLDGVDADEATEPSAAEHLAERRESFEAMYRDEITSARHLVSMIEAAERRVADFERDVREALARGAEPPVSSDSAQIVARVIAESRIARLAAFPLIEDAAKALVRAAQHAARSRNDAAVAKARAALCACEPLHKRLEEAIARGAAI